MVKVSVVIPVYNVEDFLGECLDSIANQTLHDIEIICVNDGSTDNSLEILNEYAENDNRFTIISQENGGHAVATNRGISLAKGKYLYLMDSDDILKLNALEDTVKVAEEKNVDFVIFQAINYYMDTNEYVKRENYSMNKLADFVGDTVFNWKDIVDYAFKITVTPWSKLYNREFIINSGTKFPEGLIFDDNVFFWEVFFAAKRITFHRDHLFTRRWYSASSTKAGDKRFLDSIEIFRLIWKVFEKYDVFDIFKVKLYNGRVWGAYNRLSNIRDEFKPLFFEKVKESMDEIKEEVDFDEFYDILYRRNKLIYSSIVETDDYKDVLLKVSSYDFDRKAEKLEKFKKENLRLKKENKKLKEINKDIINSNSWKLTKSFRFARNKFK